MGHGLTTHHSLSRLRGDCIHSSRRPSDVMAAEMDIRIIANMPNAGSFGVAPVTAVSVKQPTFPDTPPFIASGR